MANQEFYSRIIHKHDIEENWIKAINFIPKQGEIIIYDKDDNYRYERMKIGDGVSKVNDLPFNLDQISDTLADLDVVTINLEGSNIADPNPINADTLGGHTIDSLVELVAESIPDVDISISVDTELDTTSENPVQNKAITEEINALKEQIADIMYEEMNISSFTNNIGTVEIGSTVTNVTLSWTTNKTPTALTLDDEAIDVASTNKSLSGLSLISDKTWTLKAVDERDAVSTKTTKITFLNGVYYGVIDSGATINNSLIIGLNKKLQSIKSTTFTTTANDGQYIVYALPASYGTPAFNVGGFDGDFSLNTTFDFTNASGHTESYCVWLSDNAGLGETTVKVS